MTRTDAIDWINRLIVTMKEETSGDFSEPKYKDEVYEALDMAIKVLEQEPCEDAISRQQVRSEYADWYGYGYQDNWFYKCLGSMLSVAIPSAGPKIVPIAEVIFDDDKLPTIIEADTESEG